MSEIKEKELMDLNVGRLIRANGEVIIPMLNSQRESAIQAACLAYRQGKLSEIPMHVARLIVIEDMQIEIKHKITKAEAIEKRIYDNGDPDAY